MNPNESIDSASLYLREQEILKAYQERDPAMVAARPVSPHDLLRRVGIDVDFGFLPQGYLNLYHQDFIVEEISSDNKQRTIVPESARALPPQVPGKPTLYFDMVKVGLSTIEAIEELSRATGIPRQNFNYAGIKDKVAVTSQQVSVNDADPERFVAMKAPGLFLKNFYWGEKNLFRGGLRGNEFTIVVRTPTTLGQGWLEQALGKWHAGFYNFYYLQRFGAPRYNSHNLGRLLLQRDYEGVVRLFFTDSGTHDVPLLKKTRSDIADVFTDWDNVLKLMDTLPYTFRNERLLVEHLLTHPGDFLGALQRIPDQLALWVYAYASYFFNLHLSGLIKEKITLPKRLPLLLNPKAETVTTYAQALATDHITDIPKTLDELFGDVKARPFVRTQNTCATRAPVRIMNAKIIDNAVAIAFRLPVGVYATTFLSHIFEINRGLPVPAWVSNTKLDSKKILGLGSLAATESVLGEYMFSQALEAVSS